jgi:hypothetical protein
VLGVGIRTKYDRYIGEFVIHRHNLDHEDSGMMTNVQIVPNLGAPGNGILLFLEFPGSARPGGNRLSMKYIFHLR